MPTLHKIILGDSQKMSELPDSSVHLMVTSPPYPMIKMWDALFAKINPKITNLFNSLEASQEEKYVKKIYDEMHYCLCNVWKETFRVLIEGGIACINIGDATRTLNGKFHLFPNHARIIENCENIGFTTLPYVLWKKPTTKPHYKGKGAFLGSGFLPPNAYVTLDCEHILIFRKGNLRKFLPHDKLRYESVFTKAQRDLWFSQIWALKGTRQTIGEIERRTAAFPDEIAERLIKMFSVKDDIVLDPFLGSGTTTKVAIQNERNSIGYETDKDLLLIINKKIDCSSTSSNVAIIER